jgi:hypothetical protein
MEDEEEDDDDTTPYGCEDDCVDVAWESNNYLGADD